MADESNHSTAKRHSHDAPPSVQNIYTVLRKLLCSFLYEARQQSASTVSHMSFVASRDRLLSLYGMVLPKHSDAKLSSQSTRVRCLGNCRLLNQYDTRFLDMLPECQGHVGCNTKGILARPRCVCFHTHVQYYTFLASLMDASS